VLRNPLIGRCEQFDYAKRRGAIVVFLINDMMRMDLNLLKRVTKQVVDAGGLDHSNGRYNGASDLSRI